MVLGDSKSIPHTYTANALATESSLQPHMSGAWTMGFCDWRRANRKPSKGGWGRTSVGLFPLGQWRWHQPIRENAVLNSPLTRQGVVPRRLVVAWHEVHFSEPVCPPHLHLWHEKCRRLRQASIVGNSQLSEGYLANSQRADIPTISNLAFNKVITK